MALVPDIISPAWSKGRPVWLVGVAIPFLDWLNQRLPDSSQLASYFQHWDTIEDLLLQAEDTHKSNYPGAIILGESALMDKQPLFQLIQFCESKGIFIQKELSPEHPLFRHFPYPLQTLEIETLYETQLPSLPSAPVEGMQLPDWVSERILITGAAGSIGSELTRLLCRLYPAELILLDHAESALYDLCLDLEESHRRQKITPIVADIADRRHLVEVFKKYQPTRVYHAAACKQLPLMEHNVREAIRVNILGTQILLEAARQSACQHFTMVSTDKAVEPISVMGATKRIAEQLLQLSAQMSPQMPCLSTRFGNVLGSNGSVVPRFRRQIAEGGPVTLTDPQMQRYFVSIERASRLILTASCLSADQEASIVIFDMGKPIAIEKLARLMIFLACLKPGPDVRMIYTGLRPGEKLKESLYPKTLEIRHSTQPAIAIVPEASPSTALAKAVQQLEKDFPTMSEDHLRAWLCYYVPTLSSDQAPTPVLA